MTSDCPAKTELGPVVPRWFGDCRNGFDGIWLRQQWLECFDASPSGSIFAHPDWALSPVVGRKTVPVVYARCPNGSEDSAKLSSVAVLMPKTITLQPLPRLPWRVRLHGQRMIGNNLLGSNDAATANRFVEELLQWLGSRELETDCVLFEDLEVDSPLWNALMEVNVEKRVVVVQPLEPQVHHWICFPENPTDYWNQFSPKTRSNLRRRARRMPCRFRCFTDAGQVPEFLRQAHQVSQRSWQGKRLGVRIHDTPEERRAFEFLANHGALRSYLLEQDGVAIAFFFGIQWKGCFVFEETGYDAALAGVSPGTVLFVRLLEDLVTRDSPKLFDFGYGDGEHKRLFANRQTVSGPILIAPRRWRPMLALSSDQFRQRFMRILRQRLKNSRWMRWLRKWYRE
jgi:hypothetical protein